jgi:hypothetical protein
MYNNLKVIFKKQGLYIKLKTGIEDKYSGGPGGIAPGKGGLGASPPAS